MVARDVLRPLAEGSRYLDRALALALDETDTLCHRTPSDGDERTNTVVALSALLNREALLYSRTCQTLGVAPQSRGFTHYY